MSVDILINLEQKPTSTLHARDVAVYLYESAILFMFISALVIIYPVHNFIVLFQWAVVRDLSTVPSGSFLCLQYFVWDLYSANN